MSYRVGEMISDNRWVGVVTKVSDGRVFSAPPTDLSAERENDPGDTRPLSERRWKEYEQEIVEDYESAKQDLETARRIGLDATDILDLELELKTFTDELETCRAAWKRSSELKSATKKDGFEVDELVTNCSNGKVGRVKKKTPDGALFADVEYLFGENRQVMMTRVSDIVRLSCAEKTEQLRLLGETLEAARAQARQSKALIDFLEETEQ